MNAYSLELCRWFAALEGAVGLEGMPCDSRVAPLSALFMEVNAAG